MRKMFSENQIKNIVNQGIESGEISGGTKLYKHNVTVSGSFDEDDRKIVATILSKDATQLNTKSALETFFREDKVLSVENAKFLDDNDDVLMYICAMIYDSGLHFMGYFKLEDNFGFDDFAYFSPSTTVSDTVTPL